MQELEGGPRLLVSLLVFLLQTGNLVQLLLLARNRLLELGDSGYEVLLHRLGLLAGGFGLGIELLEASPLLLQLLLQVLDRGLLCLDVLSLGLALLREAVSFQLHLLERSFKVSDFSTLLLVLGLELLDCALELQLLLLVLVVGELEFLLDATQGG